MVKDITTLVSDIFSLLEGKLVADEGILEKFGEEVGKVFVQRLSPKEERKPGLRMSNIGRPLCQLWRELHEPEKAEKIPGKVEFKFLYGSILESVAIALAEASGHKITGLQDVVEVDGITGHLDLFCDDVLLDVKSCSPYSYLKFETGDLLKEGNDPFGYVAQLRGYAQGKGTAKAGWLAINKVSGDICILMLPEEMITQVDIKDRIRECREVTSNSNPPPRCFSDEPHQKSGNRKLGITCSYCSHKKSCWSDANGGQGLRGFGYSDKIVFLTHTESLPKVFELKI